MFLKNRQSGDLVETLDLKALFNPYLSAVQGSYHFGEEMQDPATFEKGGLAFPSDEALPRCWVDAHYRQ